MDNSGEATTERRTRFEYEELLACGRGELFGAGNAQLPLPPMLMFDRISLVSEAGGQHAKGQIAAELKVAGNERLPGVADGRPLGQVQRELPRPGELALEGEQSDVDVQQLMVRGHQTRIPAPK